MFSNFWHQNLKNSPHLTVFLTFIQTLNIRNRVVIKPEKLINLLQRNQYSAMQSRMNSEKAEALLKWVNTININSPAKSLQELSNPKLLIEIVCVIDKDYQVEAPDDKCLAKVIKYLENFYHQPLADFLDQSKITNSYDNLEIAKVLSLLLCCAVQGENVSECIDKITSLEENLQFQLKIIIEGVLKDLDNGKIDSVNITNILCQSESFRDVQTTSEEYQSSPIIMSPIPLYNSPIKALMASPQMQSRQSQLTISKLYKRLNQFQIKNNNLQRAHVDLSLEIEEKRKYIEEQDLKIQSLTKEATKVPALEEEIESLSQFEIELDEVNRKCDWLFRSTQELENYKEQFLRLEKDYSDLAAEKLTEKLGFEKRLNEVRSKAKEELQCVHSLLENSNKTCEQLRRSLREASIAEETIKVQLSEQQSLYAKETEKLKKALADSKDSRDKLCQKNDQDVLRQIARETELKQCFRDQETALQASIDHIQLQNCELKRNVEQLQISLNKEVETKTNLESSLGLSENKLNDAICKYERLQSDFISLGEESNKTMSKILEEKDLLHEALKKTQADRDVEIARLLKINEDLQEQSRCLVDELDITKHKLLNTLKDKEEMQMSVDDYCKENKSLVEEKVLLTNKITEGEHLNLKLKELQDCVVLHKTENDVLLKENSVLKDDVKERESLKRKVEALQSSLSLACEEKMVAIKDNTMMKERICMLEPLVKESTRLNDQVENVNEQLQTLKEENLLLNNQINEVKCLSEEMASLNDDLRTTNEEKQSLQEKNSSLLNELTKIEMVSEEYKELKSRFEILEEERLLEKKDMMKLKESHSSECANMIKDKMALEEKIIQLETQKQNSCLPEEMTDLRNLLLISEDEKHALQEVNSCLKDELAKVETINTDYKVLQSRFEILNEETLLLTKEKAEMVKHTEFLSNQCTNLRQLLDVASKDNLTFKENKDKLETLLEEHNLIKSDFAVANEERLLVDKENAELKEKMRHTEDLSIKSGSLRQAFDECNKEKVLLEEENTMLKDKLKCVKKSYNPCQNCTLSEKSLQGLPTKAPGNNNSNVANEVKETEFHELMMSKLDEIMKKFQVGCEQEKQIFTGEEGDIAKIEAELSESYARIVDHYGKRKQGRKHNNCVENEEITKKQSKITLDKLYSNKETDPQTQELQNKILFLEQENENLKEFQEKSKKEFLSERTKVEELEKNLRASEAAMETLNNNNVELELEVLSVQDQLKQLQEEKAKLKDYIPQVEAKAIDAENKLSEEEFISKRLAVEVRLLEAQLAHADRQLQRRVETEDKQMFQKSHVNPSGKIPASVCKMPVVAEETSSTVEESASMTEESSVAESSVANDSIASEFSMSDQKDVSVGSSQVHINNTNMLCKSEDRMEDSNMCQQEEFLKRLRRRSAVYSKKNLDKSEINDKRRSTVGSESFVVGQFSNTVADEPDEHDYEWDRILELKKRNSICARHLRSSYPVETQVCLKEEVEEEELKSGGSGAGSTLTQSRKRLRENVSDSKIFTTLENSRCLPRSKSENTFGKGQTEKISAKRNSPEANNESASLLTSLSTNQENVENIQQNRRESIAFKVDITPAKKSRMSLRARMPRSFAAEKKETVKNKSKIKSAQPTSKKLTVQRKPSSVKLEKKQLKTKRSNFAI